MPTRHTTPRNVADLLDRADRPALAQVFAVQCIDVVRGRVGRSSILSQLVGLLVRSGNVPRERAEQLVRALTARERSASTAIGYGLALPHLRTEAVQRSVGAAIACCDGTEFGSLDGKPTHLIVLLLSPRENRDQHARLMSHLAGLMSDKRVRYLRRESLTAAEVYDVLLGLDA